MAREMKDSGVEWIGEIPREWEVGKVKNCFVRKNEKAKQENPIILSLARSGVKIRDISTGEGQIAESYFNYNPVEKGDLLINPMDLYSGANCSVSKVCGVISPAYINLKSINGNNSTYYDYYFKTQYWSMVFFAHGKGVSFDNRWTLNTETLFNYFIPIPPLEEQEKIANYLDKKVSDIDLIIEKTKATIEDYKKYKHSIITEAVTKGINPNVEMKDSGIEWIGEIPREWEVKKLSEYFFQVKNKNSNLEEKNLLSLSYGKIIRKDINKTDGLLPENFSNYNIIDKGDIVLRLTDLQNDHKSLRVGLCNEKGIITSAYITLRIRKPQPTSYFYNYIHTYDIHKGFYGMGDGVRQSLTYDGLKSFKIILPSLEEQNQIVEYIDKKISEIDTLITKKEVLIVELEEYKKSLIYECVTGKKEVNENV
jgi:type I restriction enzyme S subunit